jgi:hypothetical protein
MIRKSALLIAAAILVLPAAVSANEINFAPFFFCREEGGNTEIMAAGPIFEFSKDSTALRPLFYSDKEETDFLYPFGKSSKGVTRFIPIFYTNTNPPSPHTTFFPAFWGEYEGKSYGGIFPFCGNMLHRFGKDEVEFYLWPFYMKTKVGEKNTYTLLWPFFTYSKGKTYKFFPVYGWEEGIHGISQYYLWPFFFRERGEKKMDAFLPFFQYTRWEDAWSGSVMWPFFTYSRDNTSDQTTIDAPWPLVKYARGAYNQTMVFPFYYNYDRDETYKTKMYLWPIWYEAEIIDPANNYYKNNGRILILISWRSKTIDDKKTLEMNLWPLYYITKDKEETFWHFPSVFPFSYPGVENNWAPLFTLVSYDRKMDKSHFDILWRTFYVERDAAASRWALSFLMSFENNPQFWQMGFFSDLIKIKRDKPQKPQGDEDKPFDSDGTDGVN